MKYTVFLSTMLLFSGFCKAETCFTDNSYEENYDYFGCKHGNPMSQQEFNTKLNEIMEDHAAGFNENNEELLLNKYISAIALKTALQHLSYSDKAVFNFSDDYCTAFKKNEYIYAIGCPHLSFEETKDMLGHIETQLRKEQPKSLKYLYVKALSTLFNKIADQTATMEDAINSEMAFLAYSIDLYHQQHTKTVAMQESGKN